MKLFKSYYPIILLFFLLFFTACSTTVPPPTNQAPSINSLSPTGNLFLGEPYNYDVEATDPDGDTLTYNFISNPVGMTIITSTGVINWTPTVVGNYNVTIEVSDGELSDTQSFTLTVSLPITVITPSAPINVDASAMLVGKVQITWDAVTGATHYQVYRATSLFGTKNPVSGWQTGTSYDDISVLPGLTYYYWVKAATNSSGDNASVYSSYASGNSLGLSVVLSPPSNVEASYVPGSYVTGGTIQITWDSVSNATHYQVYRTTNSIDGTRVPISGWQAGTLYDDNSVILYTRYWYWVKAATSDSGANASNYSDYDTAIVWDY